MPESRNKDSRRHKAVPLNRIQNLDKWFQFIRENRHILPKGNAERIHWTDANTLRRF